MDCNKTGRLILSLRKEKGMTQNELARAMNISDKAVSKWERGLGCPDVSLLPGLSKALGVDIEKLLQGDLAPNRADGGNMVRVQFYGCPACGNILTATGSADVSCCGRKLRPLVPKTAEGEHTLMAENVENDFYITFRHAMTKAHYLNFIAYVACDRVFLLRLYPEQGGEARFPRLYGGRIYFGCNKHGLWVTDIE